MKMTTLKAHPKYEPPKVVTYQEDEILKQMGPVGGCSPIYSGFTLGAPMNPFGPNPRRYNPGPMRRRYRSSIYQEDDEGGDM